MWEYVQTDELYHYGTPRMRWGVRRYQNPDGSLTPAGIERYRKHAEKAQRKAIKAEVKAQKKVIKAAVKAQKKAAKEETKATAKATSKSVKDMTDEELVRAVQRLSLERQKLQLDKDIASLTPDNRPAAKKFIEEVGRSLSKSFVDNANKAVTQILDKALSKKQEKSVVERSKERQAEKRIAEIDDWFEKRELNKQAANNTKNSRKISGVKAWVDKKVSGEREKTEHKGD